MIFKKKEKHWTEEELMVSIQSGGDARDHALMYWFQNVQLHLWIENHVKSNGGTKQQGEDLYHDTLITFDRLIREQKFKGQSSLKTYFCGIAKMLWLNQQRKQGREITLTEQHQVGWIDGMETSFFDREKQQILETLLSNIGNTCREVLRMYKLNFSMKEIAEVMGYSSDQVAMNKCAECRKKLKIMIESDPEIYETVRYD